MARCSFSLSCDGHFLRVDQSPTPRQRRPRDCGSDIGRDPQPGGVSEGLLVLPVEACRDKGLTDASVIDTAATLAQPLPDLQDFMQIHNECTLRHEAKHGCDGLALPYNQLEVIGYEVSKSCLWSYYQAFKCDQGSGHVNCGSLAADYNRHMVARYLNSCFASGERRPSCLAKCRNDPGLAGLGAECDLADRLYGFKANQ